MHLDETLSWPFFDDGHRRFAASARALGRCDAAVAAARRCRRRLPRAGEGAGRRPASSRRWCRPSTAGSMPRLDVRTLCLAREILGYRDGLADFAFAMQGLGTGSISLFGSPELKARYLPPVREGTAIAAFALSEPEAGSDVAAMATTAKPDGTSHVRIDGTKTWISNGGIADHYVVFARTGEGAGAKGLSAFVVDADTPGLRVAERIEVIAPHPLATLRFDGVRVPLANRLGQGRRRLQGRDGDARHLPLDRRRRRARLCAARAARDRGARSHAQAVRRAARRAADDASGDRRQRERGRCLRAPGLSRRLDQGPGRRARHPRGGDGENVRDRGGAARDRPRRAAARRRSASPRASRSRSSIGKSGRCASTRARPRCRRW